MKTLVVYDKQGNIIFTQTNATEQYNCIVEDVADGKEVVGVDVKNNKLTCCSNNFSFFIINCFCNIFDKFAIFCIKSKFIRYIVVSQYVWVTGGCYASVNKCYRFHCCTAFHTCCQHSQST